MTSRRRLANRRASTTFSFEVDGLEYIATASRYPDGAVGEIFLSNHKSNSTADVNARDAALGQTEHDCPRRSARAQHHGVGS